MSVPHALYNMITEHPTRRREQQRQRVYLLDFTIFSLTFHVSSSKLLKQLP